MSAWEAGVGIVYESMCTVCCVYMYVYRLHVSMCIGNVLDKYICIS